MKLTQAEADKLAFLIQQHADIRGRETFVVADILNFIAPIVDALAADEAKAAAAAATPADDSSAEKDSN